MFTGVEIVGFAVVAPGAETAAATILQLSRAANQVFKEKGEPMLHLIILKQATPTIAS